MSVKYECYVGPTEPKKRQLSHGRPTKQRRQCEVEVSLKETQLEFA